MHPRGFLVKIYLNNKRQRFARIYILGLGTAILWYLWFGEAALWGPWIGSGVEMIIHQIILAEFRFKQIYVARIPELPGTHV